MKKYIFPILLLLIVVNVYSQNVPLLNGTYVDKNELSFTFSEGKNVRGIKNGNPRNGMYNGSYTVIEEEGINYIQILWNDKTTDKYLIIGSINNDKTFNNIYLYNKNGYPFFCAGIVLNEWGPYNVHLKVDTKIFSASSTLKEGNIVYSTNNLDERIGMGWVEGVKGQGIGEKIIFSGKKGKDTRISFSSLYISIGLVSMDKPYLYKQNSRPKKIRISVEGKSSKIVELADTPNLQYIEYGWYPWNWSDDDRFEKDLWIEILEVYPGTEFEDTCINYFQWKYIQ